MPVDRMSKNVPDSLLRAVERSAAAGITAVDATGRLIYVNRAFCEMVGWSAEELVGSMPPFRYWSVEQGGVLGEAIHEMLRTGVPPEGYDRVFQRRSGEKFPVHLAVAPLLDDDGVRIGVTAAVTDIGRRAEAEQQLRRSEEALRNSEEQYRGLFESSPVPTWIVDAEQLRFVAVNDATVAHYGYSRDEFLRMALADIRPAEDVAKMTEHVRAVWPPGMATHGTWRHKKKDGTIIDVEITAQDLSVGGRRHRIAYALDVTDRKRLEEQFRHAQKMEAVGRLAGGVAHDFNNILSVILSYASLISDALLSGDPMREDVAEIEKAGRRATELTGQLLAFSRRQVLQPRIIDLNESLARMDKMLRRLLGEDIELKALAGPSLGAVRVDPGQIEQVVMNLAVNARDAMPDGGRLTIETADVVLDEGYAREHPGTKPGPHVMLAVSDTGAGMDEATQHRIFEPFFTTKEVGKGTGLGLSTVFGIVQQSGGSIWVYSEPGKGTSFKIYLPRSEQVTGEVHAHPSSAPLRHGGETVLVAEDEPQVRQLVRGILQRKGYEVLAAANPAEALVLGERHVGRIHLLLTDIVMPGMNGRQLAEHLTSSRPDLKVVFMSGYTGTVAIDHGILDERTAFLQKPITPDALLGKVRQVLDQRM
jgi:hypothetical protein